MVNSFTLLHELSSSLNIITPLGSPSTLELKTNLFKKTIPANIASSRQASCHKFPAWHICMHLFCLLVGCPTVSDFGIRWDVGCPLESWHFLGSRRFTGNLSSLTFRKPAAPIPHATVPVPLPFAALEFACWACSQKLRLKHCFSHWLRWERSW
jgi:hypothetical protein